MIVTAAGEALVSAAAAGDIEVTAAAAVATAAIAAAAAAAAALTLATATSTTPALSPDAAAAAAAATAAAAAAAAVAAAALALAAASASAATSAASAAPSATALGCWPMREFATLSLGYAACEAEAVAFPFVVRRCADFAVTATEADVRAQLCLEEDVMGYRLEDGGYTEHVHQSGAAALAAWDAGNAADAAAAANDDDGSSAQRVGLRCNVIDSHATQAGGMLPRALRDTPGAGAVRARLRLAYVLSPLPAVAGAFGTLHCDPPLGSGWQYLARGRKRWHVIDDGATAAPAFSRASCRAHASPPDVVAIARVARVLTADISAGDFLSFPVNAAHAVATLEASLGLSGYMSIPTPRAAAGAVAADAVTPAAAAAR
jgi:hypothetical protein